MTPTKLEEYRVRDDPSLTDGAEVYEVLEQDDLNPDWPVHVRLDVTGVNGFADLSTFQPGPWGTGGYGFEQINVDLSTLVILGKIAERLLVA